MIKDHIEQHSLFIQLTKGYIYDCLKNGTSPEMVLDSFEKLITQVMKEHNEP